jgi:hypothetical protein
MTKTISAATNPALANQLINDVVDEKPQQKEVKITSPSNNLVTLPGGYITATGEVIDEAEVRELTGSDEEAIAKAPNVGRALLTILQKGTVKIGEEKADERILDNILSADRDVLLLAIFKATFGNKAIVPVYIDGEMKEVEVDLDNDITIKTLNDKIEDRVFTIKGRKNTYTAQLPTGKTHREMVKNSEKSSAELTTIMLESCLLEINGTSVLSKSQVQNLGIQDRKVIVDEINKRLPGPQFDNVFVTDPDTGKEVRVPVNFGTLFRF